MNSEMKVTFDEILVYARPNLSVIRDINGNIKPEYSEIIKKVANLIKENDSIANIVAKLKSANSQTAINELRDEFLKIQQEEFDKLSEEEKISETYGISLDNIEHIRLRSGKEYYKFYDARTNKDIILSQNNKDKNLSEEFQDVQDNISGAHSDDALQNSEDIFKYQRMHTNNEVHMYTVQEVENDPQLLSNLNVENLKALSTILKNKDKLKIKSLNPETGLALDENHRIITAELDKNKEKYEIMYPQEYSYENFEEIKNDSDISKDDNQPRIIGDSNVEKDPSEEAGKLGDETSEPAEIDEELIDSERVKLYYEYPEMLDKDVTLTEEERNRYAKAIQKYNEKVEKAKAVDDPPKVLIKTKPSTTKNQGFASALLLALATGYIAGIFTLAIYRIINHI